MVAFFQLEFSLFLIGIFILGMLHSHMWHNDYNNYNNKKLIVD